MEKISSLQWLHGSQWSQVAQIQSYVLQSIAQNSVIVLIRYQDIDVNVYQGIMVWFVSFTFLYFH